VSFRQKEIRVIRSLRRAGLSWGQIADGLGRDVRYIMRVGNMKPVERWR
jgi:hypothetical protein